jgi:hypothetical protein
LLARPFPIPGQEFIDPLRRMILQARQDVGEPGLRVDVVAAGRRYLHAGRDRKAIPTLARMVMPMRADPDRVEAVPAAGAIGH